ncbi:MAG: Jag N-terminal domain-containing protein [Anaerolineales bacterium]|nr:Jag N-terminal domain-containing protein [Anaerolineales bacterium]
MNERTTLEIIAATVEEALAQGLAQLGLPADAVSVEVLDSGKKGLFGLGGRQVRVLLTVNGPDDAPASKTEPTPASKPDRSAGPAKQTKPASVAPSPKEKKAVAPVQNKVKKTVVAKAESPDSKFEPRSVHDEVLDKTEEMIAKLLDHMGLRGQVSAHYGDDDQAERRSICVDIHGDDLSALIGHHAETLIAFQHVASLMVGKTIQQWVQLTVDVEGYRSRRENQLKQLANRMADQVIKTGRKATLEPMPASERRLIHIALRSHPSVTTESIGEDPRRKIVILPKG